MSDSDNLPETCWRRDSIREERKNKLLAKSLTQEELIERICDLETALYPFYYCLGSIDEESFRGTDASSKLFPMTTEQDEFMVCGNDGKIEHIENIPTEDLHSVDYFQMDSIIIDDGRKLDDMFCILEVNQQAPGAHVGCGSIVMGDVRYVKKIMG